MKRRDRPNVLWIMTDEQRTDSLGCYGSSWAQTPNLDGLAEHGAVLDCAITPSPVCLPARASILTGRYPSELGVWWNRQHDLELEHLTARFAHAGYRTASFGKHHHGARNQAFEVESNIVLSPLAGYFDLGPGIDPSDLGIVRYPAGPYPWLFAGRFPGDASETAEARVVDEAIGWLDALEDHGPFLLRVSFNAPTRPSSLPRPSTRSSHPPPSIYPRRRRTSLWTERAGSTSPSPR